MKTPPFKGIAGCGNAFQLVKYKAGNGIKLMLCFIHPFGFIKVAEKIVKGNLCIYQVTSIGPNCNFIFFLSGLGYITHNGFQYIIEGNHSL